LKFIKGLQCCSKRHWFSCCHFFRCSACCWRVCFCDRCCWIRCSLL